MKLETKTEFICQEIGELKATMKEFIDSADTKYASKNVEKVVYGMIGIILTSILYYLLEHIGIS